MISIKELLKDTQIKSNYFASTSYIKGDFESGLIENIQGERLLAISEVCLDSIYNSLTDEVGSSAGLVLFKCGVWWGKSFYRQFADEVSSHYQQPLAEIRMMELSQCIQQCWKSHGWGSIALNFDFYQQGFLVVTIVQSPFARTEVLGNEPSCYLEAGMLSSFFSNLSGTKLHCIQTTCESLGADSNLFVLGLAKRIEPIQTMVENKTSHLEIMDFLCSNTA